MTGSGGTDIEGNPIETRVMSPEASPEMHRPSSRAMSPERQFFTGLGGYRFIRSGDASFFSQWLDRLHNGRA